MRSSAACSSRTRAKWKCGGKDVTGWSTAEAIKAGVGMVHQHFMLVPTLSVTENITLGAELTKGGDAWTALAGVTR